MNTPTIEALGGAALTGLLLGLASTLHCIAMCGAFALHTAGPGSGLKRIARVVAWTAGRTITYVGLGLLIAHAGRAALDTLGAGRSVLLGAAGIALVLWGLRLAFGASLRLPAPRLPARITAAWTSALGPLRDSARHPFSLGLLNGLLPCGMTGTALLTAASRADALSSGALMAGFGFATLPAFLITSSAGAWTRTRWTQPRWRVAFGLVVLAVGVAFSAHALTPFVIDAHPAQPCPLCPPAP